eukprot:GHVQ01009800.1.p1 GENE.GHVQ01009800.1~~GHVQ01009800.1.p1  ORF type:complete len:100 (-),score=13.56 GHVQ01009800.1:313-612(-)
MKYNYRWFGKVSEVCTTSSGYLRATENTSHQQTDNRYMDTTHNSNMYNKCHKTTRSTRAPSSKGQTPTTNNQVSEGQPTFQLPAQIVPKQPKLQLIYMM